MNGFMYGLGRKALADKYMESKQTKLQAAENFRQCN